MKISEKVQSAINNQLSNELYSSYLYLSMSAHFESANFKGFAKWMRNQAQEELMHAMKLYDYLVRRSGRVQLKAIEAPKNSWASPVQVFEEAYEHEMKVSQMINDLVQLALTEKDYATENALQWFVNEQVEEEDTANDIVSKLRLIGDDKSNLLLLDRELGMRSSAE